jgi:Ala-tRNA(Pro) deacylase
MELQHGRPIDTTERLSKELRCYDFLDTLGIDYHRIDHDAAMTMEACAAVDEALGADTCKNLLLCNRQCTDFYLLLIPGDKPFKTKELSGQLGVARLSFADAEDMERLLGLTPGSVSVLGLINDLDREVTLLIDKDLYENEEICCHPLINTSSVAFSTEDLLSKVLKKTGHTPITVALIGE